MSNTCPGPVEDKYFEDYEAGRVYKLGSVHGRGTKELE